MNARSSPGRMIMVVEGGAALAAIWATIGILEAPACALVTPCCFNDVSKSAQKELFGNPLPSAQIQPLPPSTANLGTTFNRLGK
jgi:hypothetical protein